jgi:hypothetical protein
VSPKNNGKRAVTTGGPLTPIDHETLPRPLLAEVDRLRSQVDRADPRAAEKLVRLLRRHPRLIGRLADDLPRIVEHSFSTAVSGEVASIREAIKAQLDVWREKLSDDSESPLEQLLVGRLVTAWLVVYAFDQRAAAHHLASPDEPPRSAAAQGHAHRRLLASAKALAAVRKSAASLQIDL